MSEMGKAMMGTGEASGDKRAVDAAEAAISNPLLDDMSMKGARGVLINITGGLDMTLFEVDEAANRIRDEVDPEANIIFGSTFDQSMEGRMRVSVVATGIDVDAAQRPKPITLSVVGGQKARPAEPAPAGHGTAASAPAAAASAPAASGSLFAQASSQSTASGFPQTKYPMTGASMTGGATMSAEPYAPATGPGASSAALAMAEEPQQEQAVEIERRRAAVRAPHGMAPVSGMTQPGDTCDGMS